MGIVFVCLFFCNRGVLFCRLELLKIHKKNERHFLKVALRILLLYFVGNMRQV